jgi:membrane protease YdiL (CAAX protease family)
VVFSQMIGAACFGIAFGALRLRTNTIWPLVALHMLSDLLLHFSALPTIPLEVVKDVILLAYAVYLLRDRRALAEPDGAGA